MKVFKNEVMPGIFRSDTALQKGIVKNESL